MIFLLNIGKFYSLKNRLLLLMMLYQNLLQNLIRMIRSIKIMDRIA